MTTTDLTYDEIGERAEEIYTRAQHQLGWQGMLDTPEDRAVLVRAMDPADRAELMELDQAAGRKLKRVGEDALAVENRQRARLRAAEVAGEIARMQGRGTRYDANPLAYTSQALDNIQGAIETRSAGVFLADEGFLPVETRAALSTSTYGAGRAWGANVIGGPRLCHVVAGVPQQRIDAIFAQLPTLVLPTAAGSVAENASLGEYATSTAASVTLARFGRWTDLSRESLIGASADAVVGMHTIGVAKDLDKVLIDMVEAAAGTAVAFNADVPGVVRAAMAAVIDNTAAADASDLVILTNPANAALLQDVTPIGGATIAERFQRFSGAIVYASSAVNTGFMTIANLRAGTRYFEARRLETQTQLLPKVDTLTVASSVVAGYGLAMAGGATGFAIAQDVVTP
jgi:hypothetical protein